MTTVSKPHPTAPSSATAPPSDRHQLQRRSVRVLAGSQILSGAGVGAGVTVGALLAQDMLGVTELAGISAALFTLGSASAAMIVGNISEKHGRRPGLGVGYLFGALGAVGIVTAAVLDSPPLLLLSMLVYGSGSATNLQARYAGSDLAADGRQGAGVGSVLVAATFGAFVGPNLVAPMGALAETWGIPRLAGPFVLAAASYAAAALFLTVFLRPDPLLTARAFSARAAAQACTAATVGVVDRAAVRLGGLAMVATQLTMAAVMTGTPIPMRDHGHGLAATGMVIGLHITAMVLPSPLTGRLADRYGSRPVIAAGGIFLLASGVLGSAVPGGSMLGLAVSLILLGLGWNLGLVGGTTLLAGAVPLQGGARIQGRVDVAVALAGATGGLSSGFVLAATSYGTLSFGFGVAALIALMVALRPTGTAPAAPRRGEQDPRLPAPSTPPGP